MKKLQVNLNGERKMFGSSNSPIFRQGILLVLSCWTTCLTGAETSIAEEFQLLKENYVEIKQVLKNLEAQENLAIKVSELEAKVLNLESLLMAQTIKQKLTTVFESAPNEFDEIVNINQLVGKNYIPRTCRELRSLDPTLSSKMYWIDPDGQGIGDDPIYVYCDMSTGSTSVVHDSESPIDVGHCPDPGCYSRLINYNASAKQMRALSGLSGECHQSIKYDCFYAPFEFTNVEYAWWNDRNGNPQYFWAGSNSSVHTCQCGIDGNCVDPSVKCNCDTGAPTQLVDDGVITDKELLPISRLNFGRTQMGTSVGIHTLGRFECTGQVVVNGLASSCEDLWHIGHTLTGFYTVMGTKMVETVYCDFTKLPDDIGFQKWIGFDDVKSEPTFFYVQRTSADFSAVNTSIPFEVERLNIGGAMNLATGIFTAPRPGTYFFSFIGMAHFTASTGTRLSLYVCLMLNGDSIGCGLVDEANTVSYQNSPLTVQSTLNLKAGDQVWLRIPSPPTSYLHDGGAHYNHFTGFMLNEEIAASLV